MKRFALCSSVFVWLGGLLHAQLSVPQPGFARFSDGSIHAVHGIAANFIVDPHIVASAEVASFSNAGGLTSSKGLIRLVRADGKLLAQYQSEEPLPVLNIESSLQSAVVWLPAKQLLLSWNGVAFTETPVDDSAFGGRVVFVKLASEGTAQFFVAMTDSSVARLLVSLPAARLITADAEPGAHGRVFVQQSWILSQNDRGLTAEFPNGTRQTIQLSQTPLPPGDLTIERMSNDWLHISSESTGTNWAVYMNAAKLSVSLLPPPVREAAQ